MSEEMDLNYRLEDIDEELNENNEMETKIIFKAEEPKSDRQLSEEELLSIYESFDINVNELNRRYSLWRLDVIHIRGVQSMSSEDILKYFEDFDPNSIEWVNDLSCNVVFSDYKASAIAMRGLTTALVVKNKTYLKSDYKIDVLDADSLSVPVPPGFRWRLGVNDNKSKALLLRFATNADKKIKGSTNTSQYYVEYGITSQNANNGSNTQRKRQLITDETEAQTTEDMTDSAIQLKTKRLRMRMRADDEQHSIKQRLTDRITDTSAQHRVQRNNANKKRSIWDRLDSDSFGNHSSIDSDLSELSVNNRTNKGNTVWKERPIRSTISVVRTHRNDLRNKIIERNFF